MKNKLPLVIAGAFLFLSTSAVAQSQEATTANPDVEQKTDVQVITTSDQKTVKKATPIIKANQPIKSETIMDRQKKADQRVSKREPKK